MNFSTNSIILSSSAAHDKMAVYGFSMTEMQTLDELLHIMNTKAVSSGLYLNGHRHKNFLKSCGNVYFIDIDVAPSTNETPYYKTVENILKAKNVSFVSVPSQSANKYPYKRHIAIILAYFLPTSTKDFKAASHYILNELGIDVTKIDNAVANDVTRQLAPAAINENFANIYEVSNYYEGNPFMLPSEYQAKYTTQNEHDSTFNTNTKVTFSDGTTVSAYDAKKLVSVGDKRACFCIAHNDTNPSATFYHNVDGSIKFFCGKCGNIKIATNFIPTVPTVAHQNYNYSIVINKSDTSPINDLIAKIGKYTLKTEKSFIWHFYVNSMSDIYTLLLAKCYLIDNNFEVAVHTPTNAATTLLNVEVLQPITVNQNLPTPYIAPNASLTPNRVRYIYIKQYIQRHGYLFAEACIYVTYQNVINPNRDFETTCNLGLAYFEYVLKTQHEQQHRLQKDKTFPMKLKGSAKNKSTKKRVAKMTNTKIQTMTTRQKQLAKLINSGKYYKSPDVLNISALAKKLNVSRLTLRNDLKVINIKRK